MSKHSPAFTRKCCACGQRNDKSRLFRICLQKDGKLLPDPLLRLSGRGAYVCKNTQCVDKAVRKKSFNKSFKKKLPDAFYQGLLCQVIDESN